VCTCIWDGSLVSLTVIKPGEICSSTALQMVAAEPHPAIEFPGDHVPVDAIKLTPFDYVPTSDFVI
jgi:hypothetical protein